MDYTALVTAIKDYVQNDETVFVSHLNDFIIATENKIFSLVEMPALWSSTGATNTADGTRDYTFSSGVVEVSSVRICETVSNTNGPYKYLLRRDYDFLQEAYPGTSNGTGTAAEGLPKFYAIADAGVTSNQSDVMIRLAPTPDAIHNLIVDYYGNPSTVSITNGVTSGADSTNETWLSVTFPEVLLYGSLSQAYTFMKGEADLIQLYDKQFQENAVIFKNFVEGKTTGDSFTEGKARVRTQ